LPDDTLVLVYQGSSYLTSFPASEAKESDMLIEEILLSDLGPGRYRLMPSTDKSKVVHVSVGKYEPTLSRRPAKGELEIIKDYIAELEKKIEEKQRPQLDLSQIVSAAATAVSSIVQLAKGDSEMVFKILEAVKTDDDVTKEIITKALEKMSETEDPVQKAQQLMGLLKEFREFSESSSPPIESTPMSPTDSRDFIDIAKSALDLIRHLRSGSSSSPPTAAVSPQPQFAGSEPGTVAGDNPGHNSAPGEGVLGAFIGRIREMIRDGGDAQDVANVLLYGLDTLTVVDPNNPVLQQAISSPETAIDMLASTIPELNETPDRREMKEEIKRIVSERIKEFKKEMEEGDAGESEGESGQ